MEDFNLITLYESTDPCLTEFRKSIFRDDLSIDTSLLSATYSYNWWTINYNEDAYKYSDKKWIDVRFDAIECAVENNKIVSMSGAKVYEDTNGNRFLRVNMFYYILKAYRGKYNGIVYVDQGFFDRHIIFAKSNRCKGMFFTIYPHSSKLRAMVANHTTRKISHVASKLKYWNDIQHMGNYRLNDVPQEFFYYRLSSIKFEPRLLIT